MANWIVALIIIGAIYLAAKNIWHTHKQGGCVGCDACTKGCCHCTNIKMSKMQSAKQ